MSLVLHLYALIETGDSLEVGEQVGELYVDQDGFETEVADESLAGRIHQLLEEEDLYLKESTRSGGTRFLSPEPGTAEWVEALAQRLEKRDFRLFTEVSGEFLAPT